MTTVLHQQYSFPSAEQLQRSWRRLRRQLDRLPSLRAARSQARSTSVDLVVGGLVDEAWPYADALVDAVDQADPKVRGWWRTYGVGSLELRCEV